ncbi:MAG TPA: hypothetical protein VNU68_34465 [Verrucomicrobiae bacterium]|jgi:hypothetical protein|nr:hypothetical protein [Verrucomicrobiae bacterium]
MNPLNPHSKLQRLSQEQTLSEQQVQAQQQQQILEFATAEEMIRYDAAQTPVPASVTERLQSSVGPVPPRSWWRRWLGQAG